MAKMDKVKFLSDVEIDGSLNFGADSQLVFGTIEGTDFIADHAKVKNAPVEDDDVVNYKTLKDWGPSITKTVKLYETTVSKNDGGGMVVWGHETFAGPDGPYIFEFTTADGRRIIRSHLDYSPAGVTRNLGTIIDEWAVEACSPPVIGSTSYYPVTVHEDADTGWTTFQLDFCGCESFPDADLLNMRFTIYMQTHIGRGYFDRIGINGDLEIAGNLSINGKRVLTEDDLTNLVAAAYKNANEEVY